MVKIYNEEVKLVQSIFGSGYLVHATGIVKVYISNNGMWEQFCVGVGTVVTDLYAKSHFLKVVDIATRTVSFSQEFYQNFLYTCPKSFFHTFEIDNAVVGFSFADETDAATFYQKVMECKTTPAVAIMYQPPGIPERPAGPTNSISSTTPIPQSSKENVNRRPSSVKKSKFKSFFGISSKEESQAMTISFPTNFRHISGIGWNPKQGAFEIRNIPPEWKQLFINARVTPKDLQDRETAGIIMNAIETYTGTDMRSPTASQIAPSLPERRPAPPPPTLRPAPRPPQPVVQRPPAPPSRIISNANIGATSNATLTPATPSGIPPSVQQRPLPSPPKSTPIPEPEPEVGPEVVTTVAPIPPPPLPRNINAAPKAVEHSNLFDQIKNGHTLKKTGPQAPKPAISDTDDSLAATIARAIDKRRKIMREDVVEESVEDAWKEA